MNKLLLSGLIASLAGNGWLLLRVLLPLRKLAHKANALERGDLTALQGPCPGVAEVESLRRSMEGMVGHVRRAQAQQQSYVAALADGQEAERIRIAQELHDDTVQSLIALAKTIELAEGLLDQDADRAKALLRDARTGSVEAVYNLRRLIADLRPPALTELGLVTALRMLAAAEQQAIPVEFTVSGAERRLEQAAELTLFRAAQEALTNAQRYSRAEQIRLRVGFLPDRVRLTIEDNGLGFDLPPRLHDFASGGHFGLLGIAERVKQLNGSLHLASTTGTGTCVEVELPFSAPQGPEGVVRDPVCSALIEPQQAYGSVEHAGVRYYFCCPVCQGTFQRDPGAFVDVGA
jgi:signal transduction histidine kinase/YHS domain-containing protein